MPNSQKINSQEFAKQARAAARRAALEADRSGGFALWRAIAATLKQSDLNSEARQEYERALRDAWFAALPLLSDQAVVDGVRDWIVELIDEEDYNITAALREKLSGIFVLEERDQLRGKLRDALLSARGKVSEKMEVAPSPSPLPGGEGGRRSGEGTPGAWLTFYIDRVGGAAPDTLKRSEFLSGAAVAQLSGKERARLKRILELFDFLRLSSLGAAGYEEDLIADFDDRLVILRDGQVTQINPAEDELMSKTIPQLMSGLKQIWAQQAAEPTAVEVEARKAAEGMKEDGARRVFGELLEGRGAKDLKGALAVLYRGVKDGVKPLLQNMHPALRKVVEARKDAERLLPILQLAPGSAPVFQLFLKVLFEQILGLTAGHAAALAGRLLPMLSETDKKMYRMIAYYDFESGEFKWGIL